MAFLRTDKIALQKPTAIAVTEKGQLMAIGFDRGSVSLYRGDISRDKTKTVQSLSCGIASITGIAFKSLEKQTQMFVCSDAGVLVFAIYGKDKEEKSSLDNKCVPTRCCEMQTGPTKGDAYFMVGRDDVSCIHISIHICIYNDFNTGNLLLYE